MSDHPWKALIAMVAVLVLAVVGLFVFVSLLRDSVVPAESEPSPAGGMRMECSRLIETDNGPVRVPNSAECD